jgi:hypothetical protein
MVMLRSRTSLLVSLIFTCCLPTSPAENRLNLSQSRQMVQLGEAARTALRDSFTHPVSAGELPAPLQNLILQMMPDDFRNECRSLMEAWAGDRGRDSSVWSVRLLDGQGDREWLAFHCGSILRDEDMERYYDERLALLRVDSGTIELLPPGPRDEENEGVLRYDFTHQITLKNATGFCFRLTVDNNPCCDGPEYRSQERLVIFVDTPNGAMESLSLLTGRKDSSHSDDPEVDTETTYHADISFEHDTHNLVTAASAVFHEKVTDITWEANKANPHTVSEHSGTLQFQWNPSNFKFEKAR